MFPSISSTVVSVVLDPGGGDQVLLTLITEQGESLTVAFASVEVAEALAHGLQNGVDIINLVPPAFE